MGKREERVDLREDLLEQLRDADTRRRITAAIVAEALAEDAKFADRVKFYELAQKAAETAQPPEAPGEDLSVYTDSQLRAFLDAPAPRRKRKKSAPEKPPEKTPEKPPEETAERARLAGTGPAGTGPPQLRGLPGTDRRPRLDSHPLFPLPGGGGTALPGRGPGPRL